MFDEEFAEYEDDEMAPEEESFPVDGGNHSNENKQSLNAPSAKNLGQLKQAGGQGSKKDADKLNDVLSKNKGASASQALANSKKGQDGEGEEGENPDNPEDGDNLEKKLDNAAKAGASEVAKKAASGYMQAHGIPGPAADKIAEEVVDSDAGQQIIDKAVKNFKNQRKKLFLKILSVAAPYVLGLFGAMFIAGAITVTIDSIIENVDTFVTNVATGAEKFLNFASGQGWNTEEEVFFKTLEEQYEFSLDYSEDGIDIALLAATIHYDNVIDNTVYEDSPEMESSDGIEHDSDSNDGMFDNLVESEETKNFYYVANDKLGSMTDFTLGKRRLIGHMVDIDVVWQKQKFTDALASWGKFFKFFGLAFSDTVLMPILTSFNIFGIIGEIRESVAYSTLGPDADGKFGYYVRNKKYETDELIELITNAFGSNGENAGIEDLKNDTSDEETKKSKGIWPAPNVVFVYDEEKYFEYLVNVYIPGTFDSKGKMQVEDYERMARDIFHQKENYHYLMEKGNTSNTKKRDNEIKVTVKQCDGVASVGNVSLEEYIAGTLYAEGGINNPDEYLKAQAIAVKNYLYAKNGAKIDTMPTSLVISSCDYEQLYCDIKKGCHFLDDTYKTLVSGPDSSGNYHLPPLTSEQTSKINKIVDDTITSFVVDSDNRVLLTDSIAKLETGLEGNTMDKSEAITMARNGSTYDQIIARFYEGEIKELLLYKYSLPLEPINAYIGSKFGYRNHPIDKCCKMHSGVDMGGPFGANIYSYADGVVVLNVVEHYSYGNYLVIGHGEFVNNEYEYYTLYAHQSQKPLPAKGEEVQAGEIIGYVGNSGASTGPHLHFEMYTMKNGTKVRMDPFPYIEPLGAYYVTGGTMYPSVDACLAAGNRAC